MFIKILTKTYDGRKHFYASLVENRRIDGKDSSFTRNRKMPLKDIHFPVRGLGSFLEISFFFV